MKHECVCVCECNEPVEIGTSSYCIVTIVFSRALGSVIFERVGPERDDGASNGFCRERGFLP